MDAGRERREFLRADLGIFINAEVPSGVKLARATDISERGVHFVRPSEPGEPEPKRVYLEFCLPDDELPLKAIGRVVHEHDDGRVRGTAIEFVSLRGSDAARLRGYVIRRNRAALFESLHRLHLGGRGESPPMP